MAADRGDVRLTEAALMDGPERNLMSLGSLLNAVLRGSVGMWGELKGHRADRAINTCASMNRTYHALYP